MKRYIETRKDKPALHVTPEKAQQMYHRLKGVLCIDRGGYWSDPEDGDIDPADCLRSDDALNPWHDFGYREVRFAPSFDPYDDYAFNQWASLTFEEFLAFCNIVITEKYPGVAA